MNIIINDLIFYIFKKLSPINVIKASLINKRFYTISKNELLWIYLIRNKDIDFINETSYCDKYKTYYGLNKLKKALKSNSNINDLVNLNILTRYKWHEKITLVKEIKYLTNLQQLTLESQKIKYIPKEICDLINLQDINLIDNEIQLIPKEISKLTNLKYLSLSDNLIEDISQICDISSLEKLHISNNLIKIIPKNISNLVNLKKLHLCDNLITKIPRNINYLINLETLNLNNNDIKIIKNIDNLNNLQRFYIKNNHIKKIPGYLVNLKKFER